MPPNCNYSLAASDNLVIPHGASLTQRKRDQVLRHENEEVTTPEVHLPLPAPSPPLPAPPLWGSGLEK
jgi:hypothetical protein